MIIYYYHRNLYQEAYIWENAVGWHIALNRQKDGGIGLVLGGAYKGSEVSSERAKT